MDLVLELHSFVRFLVLLAALIGLVVTLVSLLQRTPVRAATAPPTGQTIVREPRPQKIDQAVAGAFLGLYDLQVLLGLLIILLGGLTQAVHPIVMAAGVMAAHWLQILVKRAPESRVPMLRLAFYVVPLAIILVGLAVINHLPV
jgi:hypothetical protein